MKIAHRSPVRKPLATINKVDMRLLLSLCFLIVINLSAQTNSLLTSQDSLYKYNLTIADSLFKRGDKGKSREYYVNALIYKADVKYTLDQINLIEADTKHSELYDPISLDEEVYKKTMAIASNAYLDKKYILAKALYTSAIKINSTLHYPYDNEYPNKQLEKIKALGY